MSSSNVSLQPSPFTPDQFVSPPPTTEPNAFSLLEGFIKKRPLQLTEELVAGRVPFRTSRRRSSPAKVHGKQLEGQDSSRILRNSNLSSMDINPVTPPPKARSRMPACSPDVPLPPRPTEFLCYSPAVRRHHKKTRSINSRRLWTPPSPTKSPSVASSHILRSRPPLGRWTPYSVSTSNFCTPVSTHCPITPTSNTASVVIAADCPWTISSTSSSPYSPNLN